MLASPIVLALILGPMAEENLRISFDLPAFGLAKASGILIFVVFMGMAAAAIVTGIRRSRTNVQPG